MDHVALQAIQESFEQEDIGISFQTPYFCEIVSAKRDWCTKVHNCTASSSSAVQPCAYADFAEIGSGARCLTASHTGQDCKLPPSQNGLIAGICCTDHSKQNVNRKVVSGGNSWITFSSFLRLLDECPPDWFIVEQVLEFASEEDRQVKESFNLLYSEVAEKGYDAKGYSIAAQDYFLPQQRLRLYVIGVRRHGSNFSISDCGAFFAKMARLLEVFKLPGPCLTEVVLPDDHDYVFDELQRRLQTPPKSWESGTISSHREAWKKVGGRWAATPPQGPSAMSPWYGTLHAREKDALPYSY